MPLLTQFASFFVSPFGEATVCAELNQFLKAHRIINIEKRLIGCERVKGWLFQVEYSAESKPQTSGNQRIDYREMLNKQDNAFY